MGVHGQTRDTEALGMEEIKSKEDTALGAVAFRAQAEKGLKIEVKISSPTHSFRDEQKSVLIKEKTKSPRSPESKTVWFTGK